MRFIFPCLPLRVNFSWGMWAIYKEIFLIQTVSRLVVYFLQMYSAHQKMSYTKDLWATEWKTHYINATHSWGAQRHWRETKINATPNLVFQSLLSRSSEVIRETPLPVPAVHRKDSASSKGMDINPLTAPSTSGHLCATACAPAVKHQN